MYCALHRFAASWAEGKIMSFLFIFQQQFRAEKSLLSDSNNNELLIIYWQRFGAERNSNSPPAASRRRYVQANLTTEL